MSLLNDVLESPSITTEEEQGKVEGAPNRSDEPAESSNRPDWLAEKFKRPEDLAEAYKHLEKKLGSFKGAPEEYVIPETVQNKEFAQLLATKGRELNMSQEGFDKLLSEYEVAQKSNREKFKEQLKNLDPVEKQNVNQFILYLKNNLGDEEAEKISQKINSLEDLKVLEKLVKSKPNVPNSLVRMKEEYAPPSFEEYKKSIDRDRLYGRNGKPIDTKYRDEVNAKYAEYLSK